MRLTAPEAAARLGVKRATLYAYVSRGLLGSAPGADGRSSTFDAAEVDRLAARGRRRGAPGPVPGGDSGPVVVTALTAIADGVLSFRGRDACAWVRDGAGFEDVAWWLWTGLDGRTRFAAPAGVEAAARAGAAVASAGRLADMLRAAVAVAATADPLRFDLRPEPVTATASALVAALAGALPLRGAAPAGAAPTVAARLWPRLSARRPSGALVSVLDAALALLADHELAASTFAARIAASVRADPYAVVEAGMGTVAGSLHGSHSALVHRLLVEAAEARSPAEVVGERLRQGERVPGFGHFLYPDGDPRAATLLALARGALGRDRRWAVVDAVAEAVAARVPVHPNVDFALAAFGWLADLGADAGEAVFALARTAGWVAHAMEEYQEAPNRFRPRARYLARGGR